MQKTVLYKSLNNLKQKNRVVVLGNFNGVHKGHQALLKKGYELARDNNYIFTVFTFYPQIQAYLDPNFKYLITQEKKISLFEEYYVDEIISLPFNSTISKISADMFMKDILVKIGTQKIVIGYNFTFGYKGLGSSIDLEKFFGNKNVFIISPIKNENNVISSTFIKNALSKGDIETANKMLGYPFEISGKVIHGYKIGRKFGFPTANILTNDLCLLPKSGVYIASVVGDILDKEELSVVSIGQRPTIDDNTQTTVEVHLINYEGNLYGKNISIKLFKYIREIKKFDSIEELKNQITIDVENALNYKIMT